MSIRPFIDTLRILRYGEVESELADGLAAATLACRATGKRATVTLKISLTPGKAGQIEVDDDITLSLPKLAQESTLMFDTVEGNLQREDPRQATLPGLRQVERTVPQVYEHKESSNG